MKAENKAENSQKSVANLVKNDAEMITKTLFKRSLNVV